MPGLHRLQRIRARPPPPPPQPPLLLLLLLLLLSLHPPLPVHAALLEIGPNTCPAWLFKYERFHASHRALPGTKYLVHRVLHENGGLGDRLRGMMFATRVAAATSRVVLFSWSQPYDVTEFLTPSRSIDWRVQGTGYAPDSLHSKFFWLYDSREGGPPWGEYLKPKTQRMMGQRRHVLRGGLQRNRAQWITLSTNEVMDTPCYGCPELEPWGADATCLWHFLFRFQPAIEAAAERQRERLFGAGRPPYVAVHLRLGGFAGEPEAQQRGRGQGQLHDLLSSMSCAGKQAAKTGVAVSPSSPILMVTDNSLLRQSIREQRLVNVITSPLVPVHLERAAGLPKEAHFPTFIELLLLAKAQCLIMSESGFSHQAFLYSRQVGGGCSVQLNECGIESM